MRGEHEADLVADAARRVLVDNRSGQAGPVEDAARVPHGQRQCYGLALGHALEEDRHRQRRDLALGDAAVGQTLNEEVDLVGRQLVAVTLGADDLLREEAGHQ